MTKTNQTQVNIAENSIFFAVDKLALNLSCSDYGVKTQEDYKNVFSIFQAHLKDVSPDNICAAQLFAYFNFLNERNVSNSYFNLTISSLKLYYTEVTPRLDLLPLLKRPTMNEREKIEILSSEEIQSLFDVVDNPKQKIILAAAYALGLRLNEIVGLRLDSIDYQKKRLFILGKNCRFVQLPNSFLIILKEYIRNYRPMIWLLEGREEGQPYAERSVEHTLSQLAKKSGLRCKLCVNTLRHSYAVRLVETGIDLLYLQEIMGIKDKRTLSIYTQVVKKREINFICPLDKIAV